MMYLSKILAPLIVTLSVTAPGFANDKQADGAQGTGLFHHGKETLNSLHYNGRITLEETKVKNDVQVNGSLYSHKATIGTLNVGGHVHLVRSSILGKSDVSGFFNAENCQFRDTITFKGQTLALNNCKVRNIYVKKAPWPFGSQVVELSKKSICRGKITFESGKGRVVLKDKSKIRGKVHGAKIEKAKS
jgi:hypothetical protein